MATAANHRVIIEKGADFKIEIQATENGITPINVTGRTLTMTIKSASVDGTITVLDTIVKTIDGSDSDSVNGWALMVIDKGVTTGYATLVDTSDGTSPFQTQYNYYYTIDLDLPANNVQADSLTGGVEYSITEIGDTDFTLIGASANELGAVFIATGPGTGTGTAMPTVVESTTSVDNIRLLRGKCAIRL